MQLSECNRNIGNFRFDSPLVHRKKTYFCSIELMSKLTPLCSVDSLYVQLFQVIVSKLPLQPLRINYFFCLSHQVPENGLKSRFVIYDRDWLSSS